MYVKQTNDGKFIFRDVNEKYLDQTVNLLNSEWPRSAGVRSQSLRSMMLDGDELKLPVSLILIGENDKVIGHASISSIATISNAKNCENLAFLQSVIVDKSLRGMGLGKKLMELSEAYLIEYGQQKNVNVSTNCEFMYLTTHDKQGFYESLGYIQIEPIQFYTVKSNRCAEIMKSLFSNSSAQSDNNNNGKTLLKQESGNLAKLSSNIPAPPPPPPPPPVPFTSSNNNDILNESNGLKISWFKKNLLKKS